MPDRIKPEGAAPERIVFTLDGREVAAEPGETIWQVAKREGTRIPHLCHKDAPGYRPDGNCRACMVEIEGERVLAASCIRTPDRGHGGAHAHRARGEGAGDGDGAPARRPAGRARRRTTARAISGTWPTRRASPPAASRRGPRAEVPLLDASHVAMRVNLDACIHCNLCVRACREVQVNDVIGMGNRGLDGEVVFDFADPMGASTCVACGECVQACPTGALMEASVLDAEQRGDSAAFDREVQSVCPYCGVGCQISYKIRDDKIAWVDGVDGPSNENRLCVKGRFGFDYVAHPHRLTKPLIRRDDAPEKGLNVDPANPWTHFREASWDEALDRAAGGLAELRERLRRQVGGGLRQRQVLERGGLSLPEADPPGLRAQQRRPLHPALPRLVGGGADGERRLGRGHRDLQRDRERRGRDRDRREPDREPPGRRHLLQAVRQARRQADRHGPARRRA